MKTPEELNALKEEVEALNKKLAELTEDELAEATGGQRNAPSIPQWNGGSVRCPYCQYWFPCGTTQQEIDDHINNCASKPIDIQFENEFPFPDFGSGNN